jgi:hypothetical protein
MGRNVSNQNHRTECKFSISSLGHGGTCTRLVNELYARGGARQEVVVDVPPGVAGLIWFLRTELGGSTRFVSGKGNPRQLTIEADIELYGVPGFLAPTWGQWFDPAADNRKGQ